MGYVNMTYEEDQQAPPPHAEEAEKTVLGCMILDNEQIPLVKELLPVAAMFIARNKLIYQCILYLHKQGLLVDLVTIKTELDRRKVYDEATMLPYLIALNDFVFDPRSATQYSMTIRDKWQLREMRKILEVAQNKVFAQDPIAEIIASTEHELAQVRNGINREEFSTAGDSAMEVIVTMDDEDQSIPTGFPEEDACTYGLLPGVYHALGARPGDGKTANALSKLANVGGYRPGQHLPDPNAKRVALFTMEMSKFQISQRMLAMHTNISLSKIIKRKHLTSDDKQRLHDSYAVLDQCPIHFFAKSGLTLAELQSSTQRLKDKYPDLCAIWIDYFQLMRGAGTNRNNNRNLELGEISTGIKELAMNLEIQVNVLCQLNRDIEKRKGGDRRPNLSDLRDCGQVEQDADQVAFIFKNTPDPVETGIYDYKRRTAVPREIIIRKNRNGAVGTFDTMFIKEIAQFLPYAGQENDNAGF